MIRGMKRLHVKILQRRIAKKARVVPGQVVLKLLLGELSLVGEIVVGRLPILRANMVAEGLNRGFSG